MSLPETSVAAALAFIMSDYSAQPAPVETVVVRNAPKADKSSKVSSKAAPIGQQNVSTGNGSEASKNKEPGPKCEPLPTKGQIGPQEFLKSLALCGKRANDKGVMLFQGATVQRDDEMRLISSFIGWNPRELHGTQLENARREAHLALKPVTGKAFKRGVSATMAGFIAGLPDNQQKLIQDLLAREQIAAKAMVDHEMTIANTLPSNPAHILAKGLLTLEQERIAQIRKDLAAQGAI